MYRYWRVLSAIAAFGSCVSVAGHTAAEPSAAASPVRGYQTFVRAGCYECHNYQGQGGGAGPKLAPDPIPFEAVKGYVRNAKGDMPAYSEKVLSDDELADIYAYLKSIPKPASPDAIPVLRPLKGAP